jgi:hypothetical protein
MLCGVVSFAAGTIETTDADLSVATRPTIILALWVTTMQRDPPDSQRYYYCGGGGGGGGGGTMTKQQQAILTPHQRHLQYHQLVL